jgi:uncharacterized protein YjbI with pentapeptide repeats
LTRADFSRAKLNGARFLDNTDVTKVNFEDARLIGADLSGALNLTQKQLDDACGDAATKLPATTQALIVKSCDTGK